MSGRVVLVGAGPGDPDLLTLRAARELERAEVLLYDALIDPLILELAQPACELIDVGKRGDGTRGTSQDTIAELMIRMARAGRYVVRLKGGDPFVFGRGGEEASALREAGLDFEVVPGISSAVAVPAYAGIPVTDRRLSSSVAFITGHRGKADRDDRIDWEGLARSAETLVVLMGTAWLGDIVERVISSGRDPETPAAVIASGSTPQQRVVRAPLRELPSRVAEAGLKAPAVAVIGEVARFREQLAWYEKRPLFGRRVLVARARSQSGELALALRRRGAAPVRVPLLEFTPIDATELESRLARSAEADWIVFTSANAARLCAPKLAARSSRLRVACVGAATARAAERAGLRADLVPPGAALPERLVEELRARTKLEGASILFPHAELAGEELPSLLTAAGARVDSFVAYRTQMPDGAGEALREALKHGVDAVTLTSPSTVEHLFAALTPPEKEAFCRDVVFACIGPTTAAALARYTDAPKVVALTQSDDGLVEALENAFAIS